MSSVYTSYNTLPLRGFRWYFCSVSLTKPIEFKMTKHFVLVVIKVKVIVNFINDWKKSWIFQQHGDKKLMATLDLEVVKGDMHWWQTSQKLFWRLNIWFVWLDLLKGCQCPLRKCFNWRKQQDTRNAITEEAILMEEGERKQVQTRENSMKKRREKRKEANGSKMGKEKARKKGVIMNDRRNETGRTIEECPNAVIAGVLIYICALIYNFHTFFLLEWHFQMFLYTSLCCKSKNTIITSISSTNLAEPLYRGLSQSIHHLVSTNTWDCPGTEPSTWTCWTSWSLHRPTYQACQGPSVWHPFLLLYQQHQSAWCHLQAWWVCTWSLCPHHQWNIRQQQAQDGSLRVITCHLDIESLTATLQTQPIPYLLDSLSIKTTFLQFRDKNVVWNHTKGFGGVKVDNISYSSLDYEYCHSVVECHPVSQAWFALCEGLLAIHNHLPDFYHLDTVSWRISTMILMSTEVSWHPTVCLPNHLQS